MADSFKITGAYRSEPSGSPSGQADVHAAIDEQVALSRKTTVHMTLDADAPSDVPLGGITNVCALVLKTVGGKVRVRLTSADGSQQAVPVDGFLALLCIDVPVTAIDVTRVAATETQVHVFLGERA